MEPQTDKANGQLQPVLKRLLVKFSMGERPPETRFVGPGTSVGELLEDLDVSRADSIISKGTADTTFGSDEILYPLIEDGGLVYVTSRVDAG